MILLNRYDCPVGQPYLDLVQMLQGRDYFVLTTNVDHQFQRAGIDRDRLFNSFHKDEILLQKNNC